MPQKQNWSVIKQLGGIILADVEGCIFEIGIGRSTVLLKQLADDFGRDLYCLEMMARKCNWARGVGCNVIQGKTQNTLKYFPQIPVAMGLIDGSHVARIVRKEVHFFLEKLTVGGIIFMHDTYLQTDAKIRDESHPRGATGDPYKVRQELEVSKIAQTFTWPYTAMNQGLTMVMKLETNRSYYKF